MLSGEYFFPAIFTMDGLQANNTDMTGERREILNNGMDKGQRVGHLRMDYNKRIYSKEATVIVDLTELRDARAEDIIKAVNEKVGGGKILAVRPRHGKEYEITLTNTDVCEDLEDFLMIKGKLCEIRKLQTREYVVSFIHLPAYIADSDILEKLHNWGVTPASEIKRRMYPGTDIADGTRYLRVKFPKEVISLPYSTKFDTEEGSQYFRIMHDRQVKTCRLCMNPGHVFKNCPEFKCYQCDEQGHFARDCDAAKCPECRKVMVRCECWIVDLDGMQNTDLEDVGGQMVEETELGNAGETAKENEGNKKTNEKNQEIEEDGQEAAMDEGIWTPLNISQGALEEMEEQYAKGNEEEKKESTEGKKEGEKRDIRVNRRETIRRRITKVTPNIEVAKKKRLEKKKEQSKENILWENRVQASVEEEEGE